MRGILGIGNPGRKYELTRHNAGFLILDRFAEKHCLNFLASKYDYYEAGGILNASPFFLIKPVTYVNNSGLAALDFLKEKNISIQDLLVVTDDINLEPGKIRLRKSGGSGGHNGIESIIYHTESNQFPRLRFGIGNEFEKGAMADYVLTKFGNKELSSLETSLNLSVDLLEQFVQSGINGMLDYFAAAIQKINQPNNNSSTGN